MPLYFESTVSRPSRWIDGARGHIPSPSDQMNAEVVDILFIYLFLKPATLGGPSRKVSIR